MVKGQIKKLFDKLSLFTLCVFSLPFVVYGSSFKAPQSSHTHRCYSHFERQHAEVDVLMEKCVKHPRILLMSLEQKTDASIS